MLSLIPFCLCTNCIHVTKSNVNDVILSKSDTPHLTLFWSPYCGHCTAFKPNWKKFIDSTRFKSVMEFSDVNCIDDGEICNTFKIDAYPQMLYIVPSVNLKTKFVGVRSEENMNNFLSKNYRYPLIYLDKDRKIKDSVDMNVSKNVSLFRMYMHIGDNKIEKMYKELAEKYQYSGAKFFITESNEVKLEVYHNSQEVIVFNNSISDEKAVSGFIEEHLYTSIPQLTNSIIKFAIKEKKEIMLFYINKTTKAHVINEAINKINKSKYIATISKEESNGRNEIEKHRLLKNIKVIDFPTVVIIKPRNAMYTLFAPQSNISDANMTKEVVNWEKNVSKGEMEWNDLGRRECFMIRFNILLESTSFVVLLCITFSFLTVFVLIKCILYYMDSCGMKKSE